MAKELEKITGKKPSSGKLYPFLHLLRDQSYIVEIEEDHSGRGKLKYQLTSTGEGLINDLLERMGNLLDARMEQMLETCHHCGVQLYDSKVKRVINKIEYLFCCEHCMGAYINPDN